MFYVVSPEILINKVFWLISCLLVWLFTANLEVLLKFFFVFVFYFCIRSVKVGCFCTNLSTFPDVCELRALLVFSWCRHCHLWFWEVGDHGSDDFLLQDAEDGVTISLSVPVAFFQHLQTKRPTSSIHCLPAVFTNSVPKTQQIISWVWWSVQFDFFLLLFFFKTVLVVDKLISNIYYFPL